MKVVLLGGAGAMCTPATRDVVQQGKFDSVVIADIDEEKANSLISELGLNESVFEQVDASDESQLVSVLEGADVAINGLPSDFAENVFNAAARAKAHVCDLGSNVEKMFALNEKAEQAGITYVVGCGATPGITNVMAKHGADHMDTVDTVEISFAAVRSFALSPALLHTILWEFDPDVKDRAYYENGNFYPVPPFSGEKTVSFPYPIGDRKVYFVPHGETRTIPKNIPDLSAVYVRGTFTPKDMRLLESLIEYGFYEDRELDVEGSTCSPREAISDILLQMPQATEKEQLWGYGLNVEVVGKKRGSEVKRTYWTTHPSMKEWGIPWAYSNNVGLPLSVGAHLLTQGNQKRGVNAPEGIFEPQNFFEELGRRGINVHFSEQKV